MEQTPARLLALPSWLLTQTAAHTHRLVLDGLAEAGARGHHYRVLATLEEFGPASQATVGRHAGIHLSDVVAALNELAEQGLVERSPDPEDRRRNVVTITATGRRQLKKLDKRLAKAQEELLAPLSPDEREQLTLMLARLLEHHKR
ncbi:MarR family transcriptional regulator [Allokutzneria sp. A3M-2-11 16]|uniref:MarR family winged helix-turn-helix transcriptional regulator n=1 Tax=Allokutzneria sp. A3M-2-11 16 TaxID=2962043 RepID=UPI0020B674CA|nr:MarR family transcriptional regulator [Allokutzneria sp. A3M-2-11 16]MCP3802607.1 MarR family transcriptional regulator [Allokutzneria sp. A3M-2-11 16]